MIRSGIGSHPREARGIGEFREVSNDPEIRSWLSSQGLGHLLADAANGSANYQPTQPITLDVTENTDIRQWLTEQGLGHLIADEEGDRQNIIPAQFPDLSADDFRSENGSGRRTRSLSAGIIFPSDFYHAEPETMEGFVPERQQRPQSTHGAFYQPMPQPYREKRRRHKRHRDESSSASSSASDNVIHVGPRFVYPRGSRRGSHRDRTAVSDDEGERLVQRQRVFVRYLQPPTPQPGGPIIIKETKERQRPPPSPIIIRQTYPSPPTPLPIIYREQPPPQPPPEPVTIIEKHVPAPPVARPIIIEKVPPPPVKHPDIIIEKWLPPKHPKRREIIIQKCEPVEPCQQRITVIEPCKTSVKYVKCPETCTFQTTCSPSPVLNCIPAGCLDPCTMICPVQAGQPGLMSPYQYMPTSLPGPSLPSLPIQHPQAAAPLIPPQLGREYIPSDRDAVQQIWRALQGAGSPPTRPPAGLGAEYIPSDRQAVQDIWRALQGGGAPRPAVPQALGAEYIPSDRDAIQNIWSALQGGARQPAPPALGAEYIPSERQAVQNIWNALQAGGAGAGGGGGGGLPSPAQLANIGREYIPPERQSLQEVWDAMTRQPRPSSDLFSAQQMRQIGREYVPPEGLAVRQAWETMTGQSGPGPYPLSDSALKSTNMPFTGLLESYVRRHYQRA